MYFLVRNRAAKHSVRARKVPSGKDTEFAWLAIVGVDEEEDGWMVGGKEGGVSLFLPARYLELLALGSMQIQQQTVAVPFVRTHKFRLTERRAISATRRGIRA